MHLAQTHRTLPFLLKALRTRMDGVGNPYRHAAIHYYLCGGPKPGQTCSEWHFYKGEIWRLLITIGDGELQLM
jgi:hypothetical protein